MRSILRHVFLLCLALATSLPAQSVQIAQPTPGAIVRGIVPIAGTTAGFTTGVVSVSIDGGAFAFAQGLANWTFAWDSTTVPDGNHLIRVRARATLLSPPVFDTVLVDVQNVQGPSVQITAPNAGASLSNTFVVTGTSTQATVVELAVDAGAFQPVNGLATWNAVFEPGSLAVGPHTLIARATDGSQQVFDSISITIAPPLPGTQTITYLSSVDNEPMTAQLRIPPGYDPAVPTPLLVFLHGAGGTGVAMTNNAPLLAELDARGWIGLAPDGRNWDLAQQGCQWQYSPAYVDSPNPAVGPGEQDIFDAIDFVELGYTIDPDRRYLSGFSYGGRGTYIIGLRNPDRFAAIAPLGPAIDMLEIWVRRPENHACQEGITGGPPGTSPLVDTMYKITSGRFLIENAYNLPVFHGHGLIDTVTSNTPTNAPFLHGFHITVDGSWNACHAAPLFCFGHTPTLAELAASHPQGYEWAYVFTPVGHVTDPFWFVGGPPPSGAVGTMDPQNPGSLVGMFDFLAAHTQVRSPDTVVFKTYTDTHRDAYWLSLSSATPWLDRPAAVRANRDTGTNRISAELVRAAELTVHLDRAGLAVAPATPLSIALAQLHEPTFDPALLAGPGETLQPTIVLRGDFSTIDWVDVRRDGQPVGAALITLATDQIRIGPLAVTAATTLTITGAEAFTDLGFGLAGSVGVPVLDGTGRTEPGQRVTFAVGSALPNSIGLMILGAQTVYAPVFGGVLVPSPEVITPFLLDATGAGAVAAMWPTLPPGTAMYLQAAVLDPVAPEWFAASNGLRATTRPW